MVRDTGIEPVTPTMSAAYIAALQSYQALY